MSMHPSFLSHRISWAAFALVLSSGIGLDAQQNKLPARIETDTTWSGSIEITRDVTVSGATLTVEAGTTIRFVRGTSLLAPRLRLETPVDRPLALPCSHLRFEGTADAPILVETPEGQPPGAIIAPPSACGSIYARHVTFRRLGDEMLPSPAKPQPALAMRFSRDADDLWLSHCTFEQCGPVWAELYGEHASAEIAHCRFENTRGPVSLLLAGRGKGVKIVSQCYADAALRFECPQTRVARNVLVGPHAQIDVSSTNAHAVSIEENVVHCTEPRDLGRSTIRCKTPRARLLRNVLIGGTYVVVAAPRVVKENVLIGVDDLEVMAPTADSKLERLNTSSTTHYLIAELPENAEVTDNLFLGPCYAAITTGPPASNMTIAHNLFDGMFQARRAIQGLTPLAPSSYRPLTATSIAEAADPAPLNATVSNNLVLRYTSAGIENRDIPRDAFRTITHNVFAEVNDAPLVANSGDSIPLPATNRHEPQAAALGFAQPLPSEIEIPSATWLKSQEAPAETLRRRWRAIYALQADSPLQGSQTYGPRGSSESE